MLERRGLVVGGTLFGVSLVGAGAARAQIRPNEVVGLIRAFAEAAGLARDVIRIFGLIPTAQAATMEALGSGAERIVRSQPTVLEELAQLRIAIREDIRAAFLDRDVRDVEALWGEFNEQVIRMGEGELKRARLIALHGSATQKARVIGSYREVATFPTFVTAVTLVLGTGQLLRDSGDRSLTAAALSGISMNAARTIEVWTSPQRPKNPASELISIRQEIEYLRRVLGNRDRWIKTRETVIRFQVQTGTDPNGRPIMENRWQIGEGGFIYRGFDPAGEPIVERGGRDVRIHSVRPGRRFDFTGTSAVGTYPRAVGPGNSDISCLREEQDNWVSAGITSSAIPNNPLRRVEFTPAVDAIIDEQDACIRSAYRGWRALLATKEAEDRTMASLARDIQEAYTRFGSLRI